MEWFEIIKVRMAGDQSIDAGMLREVRSIRKVPGLKAVKIYVHAVVSGDLMVILTWHTKQPRTSGSDLAHSLSQELKRYGLIDHSVWLEKLPDL